MTALSNFSKSLTNNNISISYKGIEVVTIGYRNYGCAMREYLRPLNWTLGAFDCFGGKMKDHLDIWWLSDMEKDISAGEISRQMSYAYAWSGGFGRLSKRVASNEVVVCERDKNRTFLFWNERPYDCGIVSVSFLVDVRKNIAMNGFVQPFWNRKINGEVVYGHVAHRDYDGNIEGYSLGYVYPDSEDNDGIPLTFANGGIMGMGFKPFKLSKHD